jgi:hypothetical protein
VIDERTDDPRLFVFFNRTVFREKSYPTVHGAFRFPDSRFGRPPADDPLFFTDDLPISIAEALEHFSLIEHGWQSANESEQDSPLSDMLPNDDVPSFEEEEEEDQFDITDIGGTAINITEDEAAAVRRLSMDGFEFQTALQVFIACERDENVTRECLMSMT